MPPTSTSKSSRRSRDGAKSNGSARPRRQDAIAILKEDHREVEKLFKQFEKTSGPSARRRIVESFTEALAQHTTIEEQIVYPWAREYIEDEDDTVLEAVEEHRVAKWLLTELATTPPDDERYEARATVLIEVVRHHVEGEESEFFPDLRDVATRAELLDLGDDLRAAKRTASKTPDLGAVGGVISSALGHAHDAGKDVLDKVGVLTGVE
jgi:hemerythrin superfamily protein